MTPGRRPRLCRCLTRAITTGVLPRPPATTLPTTITDAQGAPSAAGRLVQGCAGRHERAVNLRHRPQRPAERTTAQPQGRPALRAAGLGKGGVGCTPPGPRGRRRRLRRGGCHAAQRLLARAPAVDWVAKVICVRPTRRAASITVTTDWWGAMASAADDDDAVFACAGGAAQGLGHSIHALALYAALVDGA